MCIVDQVKKIATYICEAFEDWDLDDPVEEGYLEDYQEISGASEEEIQEFEKKIGISLPDELKEVYRYKNGSKFLAVLPRVIDQREMPFSLMSLQEIEDGKRYFQNRDSLLTEFPDYFSSQDVEEMRDSRVKPYLFNKRLCHNKQLINSHFYRGVSELPYKLLFAVIYTHLEFRYEVSHTITSHHVHHFHQTRIPDGTLLDYMVQYRKPLFPQFFLYPKKFLPENNPHHKEFHLRPYIQNNANQ